MSPKQNQLCTTWAYSFLSIINLAKISFRISEVPPPIRPNRLSRNMRARGYSSELKKVGLKLINVNITDIVDESGYIEALGKEAAAHAINAARKSVAEKNRDGSFGEANALQDERTQVAAANA